MSLRITVNDDFSSNAIGWSAPTSVAPLVMALPASGTANMANKVSGGPKQTVFSGLSVPALTGGVKGTQLPFITCKNGAAGIDTGVACSSNMTLAILARASDISAETPLIGTFGLGGAPRTAVSAIAAGKMHTIVSNPYSTGGPMDKDNANVGNNEWALYVLRVASAAASLSVLMSDLTNGITAAATYAATAADTGSGPDVLVGTYQGFATGSGNLDVAAYAAWDSNLTDTDVALFQTFMRNYAAVYGQSC